MLLKPCSNSCYRSPTISSVWKGCSARLGLRGVETRFRPPIMLRHSSSFNCVSCSSSDCLFFREQTCRPRVTFARPKGGQKRTTPNSRQLLCPERLDNIQFVSNDLQPSVPSYILATNCSSSGGQFNAGKASIALGRFSNPICESMLGLISWFRRG